MTKGESASGWVGSVTNRKPKFRFGVVALDTVSVREWRELARQVEGLGYSSLLIGDHFVDFLPVAGASPILALAWAAAVTSSLRVGTLVLGNDYRHPAVLAKDAATLDLMSEGRLEFGLGAGWHRPDYDALGLAYDSAGDRVERLGEALAIIKATWTGEPFDFSGSHYNIRGYKGLPMPVQQPRPPIIVGGGSPRVLRLAGQHADIVGIHPSTSSSSAIADTQDARTLRKIDWVKEGAGKRFPELELQMSCSVTITDDARAAAQSIAAGAGAGVDEVLASALFVMGSVDAVCELLQRRRDDWGISYVVVPAEAREEFAPVVARLTGT